IGFEICEDAWVEDRPCSRLAERGVQIILNPSASHFAFGKHLVRQKLVLDAVRQHQVAYLYANLLGNEAGRAVYDGDSMIASGDGFNAIGPRFSYDNVLVTTSQIEVKDSPQSANDEAVV
ncbi:MAG TPA: NAD+ synthetase, partial [Planctomycetaceae bacterium]|nr:NAD+ synthetase [Planctomycetaceae bacterium]